MPVLSDRHRRRRRRHQRPAVEHVECGSRRVLELGRHHAALVAQPAQRLVIVVGGDEVLVGDAAGRRDGIGFEHDRSGSPSTPAAITAYRPSWPPPSTPIVAGGRIGSTVLTAAGGCDGGGLIAAVRHGTAPGRAARSGSSTASIATANSAALVAPASPIANVAVGHAGGHLHDREQRVVARTDGARRPARPAPARASWPQACPAGARRRRRRR